VTNAGVNDADTGTSRQREDVAARVPRLAVVLAGGEGSRLHPLTDHVPKPMLPLLGRPFLAYALEHLRASGVTHAVLACRSPVAALSGHFGESVDGLSIGYSVETARLGTAGALGLAARSAGETFLALNGDSLLQADLRRLVAFHRSRSATVTLLLTYVDDVATYGAVQVDAAGRVLDFVEKPRAAAGTPAAVNAGIYVIEPEALELIPKGRSASLENNVFPRLCADRAMYALALPGRFLDIGTPARYLDAHVELLPDDVNVDPSATVDGAAELIPPVAVDAGARIERGARVGPGVYVGKNAVVAADASVSSAVVLAGARVAPREALRRAIVSPDATLYADGGRS
jgi:mannose-1-phosphate guanylyltransferase